MPIRKSILMMSNLMMLTMVARRAGDEVLARDAETVAVRDAGCSVRDDETLVAALLPVGDGLLTAVLRG